jgi:hypothetical protein
MILILGMTAIILFLADILDLIGNGADLKTISIRFMVILFIILIVFSMF